MNKKANQEKTSLFNRFLTWVEKAGNALPHPATLFAIFAISTIVLSWLASYFGWHALHPGTKEMINPVNLISHDGLHRIILEMVENYTSFAPLGIVMVAMLGIGIAESSGQWRCNGLQGIVQPVPHAVILFCTEDDPFGGRCRGNCAGSVHETMDEPHQFARR